MFAALAHNLTIASLGKGANALEARCVSVEAIMHIAHYDFDSVFTDKATMNFG